MMNQFLEENPDELIELIDSLTINVTEFFRNPESFRGIDNVVIPNVIKNKQAKQHKIIRCWSCGCSHGDEPYSLAMLLLQRLGHLKETFKVTVYGTDIDTRVVNNARNIICDEDRLKDVDSRLRSEYFENVGGATYRPTKEVRDIVKFRYQDVVKDKPLLHCDIVLCRNLLIYFNKELQEEILLKFYECLNPGGYLVLGMVESLIGAAGKRFEVVDNRLRIYRRSDNVAEEEEMDGMLSQDEIDKIVNEMIK